METGEQVLWKTVKTQMKCDISSGSALFCTIKQSLRTEIHHFIKKKIDWQPLKIQNGHLHTCCINMNGIIHQKEKGLKKKISMHVHWNVDIGL